MFTSYWWIFRKICKVYEKFWRISLFLKVFFLLFFAQISQLLKSIGKLFNFFTFNLFLEFFSIFLLSSTEFNSDFNMLKLSSKISEKNHQSLNLYREKKEISRHLSVCGRLRDELRVTYWLRPNGLCNLENLLRLQLTEKKKFWAEILMELWENEQKMRW